MKVKWWIIIAAVILILLILAIGWNYYPRSGVIS